MYVLALRKFCGSFSQFTCENYLRIWATQGNIDAGRGEGKKTRKVEKAKEMGKQSMKLQKIASKAIHDTSAGYTGHTDTRTHTHTLQHFPVYLRNHAQAHDLSYALQHSHLRRQIEVDLFYLHFGVVVAADFLLFLLVASV